MDFTVINENNEFEIIEKKSRFIASLFYVQSIEEVEEKRQEVKEKYHGATHYCYAYRIYSDESIVEKASDDGEPAGTAGVPMLQLLKKYQLINVLVIVTRYFGGTLLGTGGLVRAYTEATKQAIQKNIVQKVYMRYRNENRNAI